ncbi:MAG: efflux RND transporter permease subunit, partial [Thermoguttaceae bacterium]|nr:efflux RND transporter permease subunit [Thermoguttaceae bacterium]
MSHFFIERPIFAWVVAILISLAGAVALFRLPICQYPDVAPTRVSIGGSYPGASAQTIQDAVVQIIEQQMTGLDGFQYMSSTSSTAGDFSVDVTFRQGTNSDIAQMQAQNKLSLAMSLLPEEVKSE